MTLFSKHAILDSELNITEKIFMSRRTLGEGEQMLTRRLLIGKAMLKYEGVVTLKTYSFCNKSIILFPH